MITRIVIAGCCGRMGRRIASLAFKDEAIKVVGAAEVKGHPDIGRNLGELIGGYQTEVKVTDDLEQATKDADVIIDFTTPTAVISNLSVARKVKIPMVIGTTGLTDEELKLVSSTSNSIPVLLSANMSVGVNLLFRIAPEIASVLGEDYDIEIIEAHHNKKKDAPSGTAKKLAELIAEAKGKKLKDMAVYGREGKTEERPKGQMGIHAVRAGGIIGDHTVIYADDNERIELTHRAHSRDVFAQGALRAAKFIADKSPGLYDMQDVVEGL